MGDLKDSGLSENDQKSDVYKYFYNLFLHHRSGKKVGIITDERCLIRNVKNITKGEIHAMTVERVTKELGMEMINDAGQYYNDNNAHFLVTDDGGIVVFTLGIPPSDCLGFGQFDYFIDIISAFEDARKNHKSEMDCVFKLSLVKEMDLLYDCKKMRKCIEKKLEYRYAPIQQNDLKNPSLEEGEFYSTHSEAFKFKDLYFNLRIDSMITLGSIFARLSTMQRYSNNPFYHNALLGLIPDFPIFDTLFERFRI